MNFIKHPDKEERINLDNVVEYLPVGKEIIKFVFNVVDGVAPKVTKWNFDTTTERDSWLDDIDEIVVDEELEEPEKKTFGNRS